MPQTIGSVLIDVQADTQKLVQGFDKAERTVSKATNTMKNAVIGLTTAYLSLEGVNAFSGMIKGSIDAADSLGELAEKLSMSTSQLSELEYVSGFAGVTIGQLDAAISAMIRRTNNFKRDGSGAAAKAMEELGISAEFAKENFTDTHTTFNLLIDRLREMPDGFEKTAAAQDIFSKSASSVVRLANKSKEEIKLLGEEGRKTGAIFTNEFAEQAGEVNDSLDRLTKSVQGMKNNLSSELAPTIIKAADGLNEYLPLIIDTAKEITHLAIALGSTTLAFKAYGSISKTITPIILAKTAALEAEKNAIEEGERATILRTLADKANRTGMINGTTATKAQIRALNSEAIAAEKSAIAQTKKSYALNAGAKAMTFSTLASKAFSAALRATPFGIATTAIYLLSDAFLDNADKAEILEKAYSGTKEKLEDLTKNQLEYRKSLIETELTQARLDLANAKADVANNGLFESKEEQLKDKAHLDEIREKFNNLSKASRDTKKALNGVFEESSRKSNVETNNIASNASKTEERLTTSLSSWQSYYETLEDYATAWAIREAQIRLEYIDATEDEVNKLLEISKAEYMNQFKDTSSIDGLIEANDQMLTLLDSQIALSESALDWNANLDGVAKSIQNISDSTMDLGTIDKKTDKERLKAQNEFYKLTKDMAKDSAEYKDAEIYLSKRLNAINEASLQAQLNGYGSLAGAMSEMFDEGSKEAEALIDIQRALSIVTGVTAIANAMSSGDGYTAVARGLAVAATLASFGWEGTGSGSDSGSFESTYKPQAFEGGGTVLGDASAQSESMANSLNLLEELARPEFRLLSGMAKSLESIDEKIAGVAANILQAGGFALGAGAKQYSYSRSYLDKPLEIEEKFFEKQLEGLNTIFGDNGSIVQTILNGPMKLESTLFKSVFKGLFGGGTKYTQTLVDSGLYFGNQLLSAAMDDISGRAYQTIKHKKKTDGGWFGSDKTKKWYTTSYQSLDQETENQFELILTSFYNTMVYAGEALEENATAVEDRLDSFVIKLGKISLKGKSSTQITEALTNVFNRESDRLATYVFPNIAEFQQVGEGMFEALVRVAAGMEEAEYYINRLGYAFEDVDYKDIVNKQGDVSLEVLTQSIVDYDEAVYGLNNGVVQMVQTFNGSAEELYETYTLFEDVRDMLSLVGKEAQYLTSEMLLGAGGTAELADALEDYFTSVLNDQQKLTFQTEQMQKEFEKLNLTMPTSIEGFKALIDSVDISTSEGQELLGRIVLLSSEYAKLIDDTKEMFYTQVQNALDLQTLSLEVFDSAIGAVRTMSDNFTKLEESIEKTVTNLLSNSDGADAQEELIKSFWETRAEIDTYLAKDGDLTDSEASKLSSLVSELNSLASGIQNAQDGDNTDITNSLVAELQNLQAEINFDNEILRVKVLDSSGNETDVASVGVISALQETLAGATSDPLSLLSFKNGGNDLSAANEITFRSAFEAQSALSFADELSTLRDNLAYINLDSVDASAFFGELKALDLNAFENMIEFFNTIGAIDDNEVMINGQKVQLPSYDVGSPYITHDQIAQIHQGEMVLDRDFSDKLRRYGIPAVGGVNINLDGVIRELEKNREIVIAQANEIRSLRKATENIESTMLSDKYEGIA